MTLTVAVLVFEIVASRRAAKKSATSRDEGIRSAVRPMSVLTVAAFGLVALGAMVLALDFTEEGRLFPLITAGIMLVLAAAYVTIAYVPSLRTRLPGVIADGGSLEQMVPVGADLPLARAEGVPDAAGDRAPSGLVGEPGQVAGVPEAAPRTDTSTTTAPVTAPHTAPARPSATRDSLLLLTALGVGSLLFGIALTVPPILFLFLRGIGRESWRMTAYVGIGAVVFLYVAFVELLEVPLSGGLLLNF